MRILPDGSAAFVFMTTAQGLQSVSTIALQGDGQPRQFAPTSVVVSAGGFDVSSDGRFVALLIRKDDGGFEMLVVPSTGGDPVRRLAWPRSPPFRWMPDGRGFAYVDAPTNRNIWVGPLDGGAHRQLTHFTDKTITAFEWSHDGKQLALARTTTTSDNVLLKGVR